MTLKFILKGKKQKRDALLVIRMDFGKETELPWTGSGTCSPRTSTKTKGQQRLMKPHREIYFPAGSQTELLSLRSLTARRVGGLDKFCCLEEMSQQS